MSTDYSRALGARLRAIRNQQGLSLQGVEDKSHGRWKAVVVGSYERGDRAVTVQRLSELAVFYGVPVSELLPDPRPSSAVSEVTPASRMPHGTIRSNSRRSALQFNSRPCIVTPCCTRMPMAAMARV